MTLERLDWHLHNWTVFMRSTEHKLGYPAKSLCLMGGGGSSEDEFESMCEAMDMVCAHSMNGVIDSISKPQQTAINHVWLKVPHHYPTQALDYEEAIDSLIKIAIKRKLN